MPTTTTTIPADPQQAYAALVTELREVSLFASVGAVLSWDEQTFMPPGAAEHRAEQASLVARVTHERATAPRVGELLAAVEHSDLVKDPEGDAAVNVRVARRDYDRATKLPPALVEEMARTEVLAQQAWAEARRKSDYPAFRPWLEKVLKLKRQECACVGYADDPYDALLDQYEPGETAATVRATFEALRGPLVELVGKIVGSGRQAPLHILERHYPAAAQERLSRDAATAAGFDFARGRLDVSVHPFSTQLGRGDVRITTRYDEANFADGFFSTLHEVGHALYNQGLPPAHYGTPRGRDVSLGIHESQSRMWENLVGRSRAFWQHFLPQARAAFPQALAGVSDDQWHFAVNDVRPSLIRTESDEATYNLHVLLRFEVERALLREELSPDDLPTAWDERMERYLGVRPPNDAQGCLQDIHWAGGAVGYFPTYTLGNLYAAQFFERARADLGDLDAQFARGDFKPLLDWLRQNIHDQGMKYAPRDLVRRVTGQDLQPTALLAHLRRKAAELYGVG
ncbi:MAG: Thermostable carboxypeptidase 1 [uncultured Phycisphaerae bacterium]|uniref:Metal-dependent carboxypeptidase n=1 Tax=uncultured Phycisphaerae bacterium TaxID=904963 RepID=A0A6J4NKA1_9BACT|nr:MAG: Thermostable carboxypeptidase 1 [uncultured Phycisphaerae bacterium]